MATIKEVATTAGVSTATVSNVINGTRYVSPELAKKVQETMDMLEYVPNLSAFTLRTQKTKTISLLIPLLVNETDCVYFSQVARGVEKVLRAKGYSTILGNTNDNTERELEEIKNGKNRMVDGMIITPTADDQSFLRELDLKGPIVFIDRPPPGLGDTPYIISDTLGGCCDAIHQLIALGHKKIGFLLDPMFSPDERLGGYKRALLENGLPYHSSLVRTGKNHFEEGYRLGKELLIQNPDMTALFLATNLMAQGTMQYIREQNIEVPEKLSVLVFDDYEWSRLHNPPLTTIRQDAYGLGKKAAEILLEMVEGKKDIEALETRLPMTLMERSSWAPPAGQ